MPEHELTVRKAAEADLEAAFDWYEQERIGLGDAFLEEVENSLSRIRRGPRSYPQIKPGFRCALVKRFPYVVYFRIEEKCVIVFAVLHGRRDPQIVAERIKSEE